jgi:lipopolysaccharide transport system ATP-binding protein
MSSDVRNQASEITVCAEALSKLYLLWDNPRDRLKQPVRSRLHRWFRVPQKQYFHEFWALRDISFELRPGQTLGIIGRNGSGKSTLLQMLAGTLSPTTGTCDVRGRVSALLELGSGFNPEFTGRDNVYMNAAILGLSKAEIDQRYPEIVAFADIGEFTDQPVKTYSSGMFVRLAFSVAINTDPEVLVVDEALAVGDAFFVQKCMRFMREFKERGTLLFVSHDTDAVAGLCDLAMLLDHGSMKAYGGAREVCDLYRKEYYSQFQAVDGVGVVDDVPHLPGSDLSRPLSVPDDDLVDQRHKYLSLTQYRNDLELMRFDPQADSFGAGGARLIDVCVLNAATGSPCSWVVGGELVAVQLDALLDCDVAEPILGFLVRDRLGQVLFGDNTYITYRGLLVSARAGEQLRARFTFRMPVLPAGDYFLVASVADGTQTDHRQLHWVNEALLIHSRTSSVCTGLVGVPMQDIVMTVMSPDDDATARRA